MTDSVTPLPVPQVSTRFPDVTLADVLDELRREQTARRRTYPQQVERCRMTQAEADHQLALVAGLIEDVNRYHTRCILQQALPPATHGFTWAQRRATITRELAQRARLYPQWIASGKLDQADADRATMRLTALADIYDDGFDWHATNGLRVLFGTDAKTEAEREAQNQWHHHYTTTMQARGYLPPAQEQLAL